MLFIILLILVITTWLLTSSLSNLLTLFFNLFVLLTAMSMKGETIDEYKKKHEAEENGLYKGFDINESSDYQELIMIEVKVVKLKLMHM